MYSAVKLSMFSAFDMEPARPANLFVTCLECDRKGQLEEGPIAAS